MPIHPDFIRHGVRAREVVGLENWVQEGVGLFSRRAPGEAREPLASFPRHHLVMNGGEQDRTLVGTLSASRDRSGRAYPFVVFSLADEPLFREMQAAVPLAFDAFFQNSDHILDAPWNQEPVALLLDRVDGMASRDTSLTRRQYLERQIALLGDISMGQFWSDSFPDQAPNRQGLFEALFSALRSAARRGPGRVTWGLRLPLGRHANALPMVVFWVQMVEAILEERHWRAHYFWHGGDAQRPGALTLFFRPLAASLFLWLMPGEADEAGLFDLRGVMNQRSDVRCAPELARMLLDDEVSMLDLLYRAGRREVLT
ncbi:type VI secretion system-associated protein TagF [Geoalkalibacter halelectricus]|uniref:Type VI secretion system-associated protein TagF n=2 Tax=Geoalkalibacter halelectricus TaxID=2847045 RepID=A0ABY5ZPN0_9BACT|nr:type VI secretion system-associated protein TagF [Geoalkalibacter halelectricus]UWZ81073.1 type VI secretion system-associated protein TagF [Geoalkalibacter halelectricus]